MTDTDLTPLDYATAWNLDLDVADMERDRSMQTHNRELGVSDVMHCHSYAARFLSGHPFTDAPNQAASRRGTWLHAGVLPAIAEQRPLALIEQEVSVTLPNGFLLKGHADLIEPDEPSVTDVKSVDGTLPAVRRNGANEQQKFQRHAYAAGAHQGGLVAPTPFAATDIIVRNLWMDISDLAATPHVEQELFDPTWLDSGARWVDEVYTAVEQDDVESASRDKDWFFCQRFCNFFTACRGPAMTGYEQDTIEDNDLAVAAAMQREGLALEKEGAGLKKAAKEALSRLEGQSKLVIVGSDGQRFRWSSTWTKPTDVAYARKGYFTNKVEPL